MLVPVVCQYPAQIGTVMHGPVVLEAGMPCRPLFDAVLYIRNCSSVSMRVTLTLVIDQGASTNALYAGTYRNLLVNTDVAPGELITRKLDGILGDKIRTHEITAVANSAPGGKLLVLLEGAYESVGNVLPAQQPVVW